MQENSDYDLFYFKNVNILFCLVAFVDVCFNMPFIGINDVRLYLKVFDLELWKKMEEKEL